MGEAHKHDWMNPMNRILIQRAIRRKASTVTLDDGFTLKIELLDSHGSIKERVVKLSPTNGEYVPMGFFPHKKIIDPLWLTEGQNHKAVKNDEGSEGEATEEGSRAGDSGTVEGNDTQVVSAVEAEAVNSGNSSSTA